MSKSPSRLAALNLRIVDSIRPECLAAVEALVNDQLSISATPGEVSNLIFAITKNHPHYFNTVQERGLQSQNDFPPSVANPRDLLHGRPDLKAMSASDRLAWVYENPWLAEMMLDEAKARKK